MNIKELIEAEKKKGVSLREMARRLRWSDVDFERGTVNLIQKGGSTKSLPMGGGCCIGPEVDRPAQAHI